MSSIHGLWRVLHPQIAYAANSDNGERNNGIIFRIYGSLTGSFGRRVFVPVYGHTAIVRSKDTRLQNSPSKKSAVRPHENISVVWNVFYVPTYAIRHAAMVTENLLGSTLPLVFCRP